MVHARQGYIWRNAGTKGEGGRGDCNEVNSLMFAWVQIIMSEFPSSICLVEKHHKVPSKIVIYILNLM